MWKQEGAYTSNMSEHCEREVRPRRGLDFDPDDDTLVHENSYTSISTSLFSL